MRVIIDWIESVVEDALIVNEAEDSATEKMAARQFQ